MNKNEVMHIKHWIYSQHPINTIKDVDNDLDNCPCSSF